MIRFINYDDFFDSVNGIIIDNMYDDQYMPNLQPHGGTPKKGLVKQSDIATLTEISWDVTPEYYNGVSELTAYRKYTPGHWEDADGNWINGSWGNWEGNISQWIEWNTTFNPPCLV